MYNFTYILFIKRPNNLTAPLRLVSDDLDDNVPKFEEWYKNYSSPTLPYFKWNHKVKNYLIATGKRAVILFTRHRIYNEEWTQAAF